MNHEVDGCSCDAERVGDLSQTAQASLVVEMLWRRHDVTFPGLRAQVADTSNAVVLTIRG